MSILAVPQTRESSFGEGQRASQRHPEKRPPLEPRSQEAAPDQRAFCPAWQPFASHRPIPTRADRTPVQFPVWCVPTSGADQTGFQLLLVGRLQLGLHSSLNPQMQGSTKGERPQKRPFPSKAYFHPHHIFGIPCAKKTKQTGTEATSHAPVPPPLLPPEAANPTRHSESESPGSWHGAGRGVPRAAGIRVLGGGPQRRRWGAGHPPPHPYRTGDLRVAFSCFFPPPFFLFGGGLWRGD